jgi:hypothetical protein
MKLGIITDFPQRCHDEAEKSTHMNEHANRMICGYCSREQNYRPDDCQFCHSSLVAKIGSGFWEGGKGEKNPLIPVLHYHHHHHHVLDPRSASINLLQANNRRCGETDDCLFASAMTSWLMTTWHMGSLQPPRALQLSPRVRVKA